MYASRRRQLRVGFFVVFLFGNGQSLLFFCAAHGRGQHGWREDSANSKRPIDWGSCWCKGAFSMSSVLFFLSLPDVPRAAQW